MSDKDKAEEVEQAEEAPKKVARKRSVPSDPIEVLEQVAVRVSVDGKSYKADETGRYYLIKIGDGVSITQGPDLPLVDGRTKKHISISAAF